MTTREEDMPAVNESPEEIGKRVLIAVKLSGLSQKEFAEVCGFTDSLLSRWIQGKRRLPLEPALSIRRVTNLPLDYLYFGNTDVLTMATANQISALDI